MGGDIGEIKLGLERELYKYINHYVVVKREKEETSTVRLYSCSCLKKNPNATFRPSEHPLVRGGGMSKCLGGIIIGCK